jgi:hypothetical protein
MVGISHCVKLLSDLESAIIAAIKLARSNSNVIDKAMAGVALAGKLIAIIGGLRDVLPELADIDPSEAGELSKQAYSLVLNVIKSIK